MPIYEYQCQSCGHELEVLQKISDPSLTECPECHQDALQKKVSAAGFRLKGSGWYETDFKKSSEKKRNLAGDTKENSKSSSEKSSQSNSSTEKKTATG